MILDDMNVHNFIMQQTKEGFFLSRISFSLFVPCEKRCKKKIMLTISPLVVTKKKKVKEKHLMC